jgi:hypothetical protein
VTPYNKLKSGSAAASKFQSKDESFAIVIPVDPIEIMKDLSEIRTDPIEASTSAAAMDLVENMVVSSILPTETEIVRGVEADAIVVGDDLTVVGGEIEEDGREDSFLSDIHSNMTIQNMTDASGCCTLLEGITTPANPTVDGPGESFYQLVTGQSGRY